MRLTVLNVAFPLAPVGPDAVGGAEQVLGQLDAALVRAGHRSIVVACEGSRVAGTLVSIPPPAPHGDRYRLPAGAHRSPAAGDRAVLDRYPVDVVHLHGIDFHAYLPPAGVPAVATLHLPLAWYPPGALRPGRPGTYLHCVSASQRRARPPGVRTPAGHRERRADPARSPTIGTARRLDRRRRFAVALGRVCPEKNFHVALDAAARAGVPVLLAGRVFGYEPHERYFREQIAPRLDRKRRFIGPVGFGRKRRLLNLARCLLLPSLAPETSSLVAMEALARAACRWSPSRPAPPDIVRHGVTGFLVKSAREMADGIHAAARLDPEACRDEARRRFSIDRTIGRYLDLYQRLAAAGEGTQVGNLSEGALA